MNLATRELFKAAGTPQKMAQLGEAGLTPYISRIGLYKSKAKNVAAMTRILLDQHGGKVPSAVLMTTKLVPQTATTASASRKWRRGRAAGMRGLSHVGAWQRPAPAGPWLRQGFTFLRPGPAGAGLVAVSPAPTLRPTAPGCAHCWCGLNWSGN